MSHRGQSHLKTITRARPVSLKPPIQHLLSIGALKGAWGACTRRLFWRLFVGASTALLKTLIHLLTTAIVQLGWIKSSTLFVNIPKKGEFTHSDLLSMFLSSGTQILEEDLKLSKPEQERGHILPKDAFGYHWNSRGLVLFVFLIMIAIHALLHTTTCNFLYNESLQALLSCFASFINGLCKGVLGTLFP